MLSLRPSRTTPCPLQIKVLARRFPSTSRDVISRGVVPVAERNGWWLKHPQPNMITSKGLAPLVRVRLLTNALVSPEVALMIILFKTLVSHFYR
jgi:hypothetical protein